MCNSNLCSLETYCEMGGYCKKVHPNIRRELLKGKQPSAIDVEIFKANGSGVKCTRVKGRVSQ